MNDMKEPRDEDQDDERSDFDRYLDDGTPMNRKLTQEESTWVYLNLK